MFMVRAVCGQEIVTPQLKASTAFIAGETLSYQIKYGFVVGGTTTLTLSADTFNNKLAFHALATGKTTGVADKIYGVEDIYESWFDPKTNLPYKSIRNIKEGRYRLYNEVIYDHQNNSVKSKLSGIHNVPKKILDLSSTLYFLRRIDFSKVSEGDVILINMYFSDEVFPFYLRYSGKETIRTKIGKIQCIKISPIVEVGRMFKSEDDLTIWFSDDDNSIPVLVRMDIRIVGSINLKLISYENIANPFPFQTDLP